MDDLQRLAHKVERDTGHLRQVLANETTLERASLALSIAKRVRRDSTLLVRRLADQRDQLQP